jgi:hypothetical protein
MFSYRASHRKLSFLATIHGKTLVCCLSYRLVGQRGDPRNGNVTRNDHDLVLFKLQHRARLTDRVRPVRLPNPLVDRINPETSTQCVVSGFGTVKDARQSHILKYLTVPLVGREEWYAIESFVDDVHEYLRTLVLEDIVQNVSKIFISAQAIGTVAAMRAMAILVVHWCVSLRVNRF